MMLTEAAQMLADVARTQGKAAAMASLDRRRGQLTPREYDAGMQIINMNAGGMIAPNKKGTFKAQATRMGMSVPQAAKTILAAPEGRYSPEMRRKANFARNFNMGGDVPHYNTGGGLMNHPYNREGEQFDTVPAMLTPGEFVVDADSAHKFGDELEQINNWEPNGTPDESGEEFISEDEAVEIKRKFKDGTEIIVKSPEGSKTEVSGLLSSLTKAAKRKGYEPQKRPQASMEGGLLKANPGAVVPNAPMNIFNTPAASTPTQISPEQQAQARSQQLAGVGFNLLGNPGAGSALAQMGRDSLAKTEGPDTAATKFAATNYRGSDGKNYKQITEGPHAGRYVDADGNYKPNGVTVRPIGSGQIDSKVAEDAYSKSENAAAGMQKIDSIAEEILRTDFAAEGAFGSFTEFVKGILGTQGGVSVWKTKFKGFINSEVVNNLPPGVASDKDIQLARSGFPDENWDKDALLQWMAGYRKQLMYSSAYFNAKAEYLTETGSQSGFRKEWLASEAYRSTEADVKSFSYGGGSAAVEETATQNEVPTVSTQAEVDALPSGTVFIWGPNGKRYRKD